MLITVHHAFPSWCTIKEDQIHVGLIMGKWELLSYY